MHGIHITLLDSQPELAQGTRRHDPDEMLGVDRRAKPPSALLLHDEMAHSVTAVQRQELVFHLQRQLGNTHVGRILEAQRGAIRGNGNSRAVPMIKRQTDSVPPEQVALDPVPPVSGIGEPHEVLAFAPSPPVRLRGRTRARFNGGNFRTENVVTEPGFDCKGCRGKNCVHVTGTVITEYHVTTTVTLPGV